MKTSQKIAISLGLLVAILVFTSHNWIRIMLIPDARRIHFYMPSSPTSADPVDYDSFYHHIAFRSVFGSLVSQYRLGEYTPEIAESWHSNLEKTVWTFKLRRGLTFSNGDAITPEIVSQSWLRMAKIMKARKSNSGFLEFVLGFDKLVPSSSRLEGIEIEPDTIVVRLSKPLPGLLEAVSFGLYAIIHPSSFDPISLNWIAKKEKIIASGPYQISEWNDQRFVLSLRNEYPKNLVHRKPIEEIEIFWNSEAYSKADIDIAMGSELSQPPQSRFVLQAGPPSYIYFMRILSFRNQAGLFYKKSARIAFRNEFYQQLESLGFKAIRSFFPLIIKGVSELTDTVEQSAPFLIKKLILPVYPTAAVATPLFGKLIEATKLAGRSLNLEIEERPFKLGTLFKEIAEEKESTEWDIARYGTAILAHDPLSDVRFMFRSKEGILLPDESGQIDKELDKDPLNIQKVNELLWEDGLIWPVTHYRSGLWARPDIDFSEINLVLPPTSFQWIGWK